MVAHPSMLHALDVVDVVSFFYLFVLVIRSRRIFTVCLFIAMFSHQPLPCATLGECGHARGEPCCHQGEEEEKMKRGGRGTKSGRGNKPTHGGRWVVMMRTRRKSLMMTSLIRRSSNNICFVPRCNRRRSSLFSLNPPRGVGWSLCPHHHRTKLHIL